MALMPFNTQDPFGKDLFVSPLITQGQNITSIPYAERPGSPQESYTNNTFRVRRTFDVPWHLRWYFMYALMGDAGLTGNKQIFRRIPHAYHIRDFPSIYDYLDNNPADENKLKKAWLYATSVDSVEPIAFDGKDSLYVTLTDDQLFGDIANAGKFDPTAGDNGTIDPVSGNEPVLETIRYRKKGARRTEKSLGEENPNKASLSNGNRINRLRTIREVMSRHEIEVVYKDVIQELKKEEKRELRSQKTTAEEKKEQYKKFIRDLKKENKKPIQTSNDTFNALKGFEGSMYPDKLDGSDTGYQFENAPSNAYPELVFAPGGPLAGVLDTTAVCKYKLARITVSYENLNYRITSLTGQSYSGVSDLWYDSYTTFYRMPTAEVLSLPFGAYRFYDKDPAQRYVITGSNMRLISQEEIMLTWHQVPFVPDAVRTHIGKVNSDWFPIGHLQTTDDEQKVTLENRLFAAPGTLLLTNVELKPYKGFFSRRIYDINFKFKYFHAVEKKSNGEVELAFSDELYIIASDPCKPVEGDTDVCQKMAKGHNFFLKYKYFNPKAGTAEDQISGNTSSGLFNNRRSGTCSVSGSVPVYDKCDSANSPGDFYREYLTHDGCPTGNPVYQMADFAELFSPPIDTPACSTDDKDLSGIIVENKVILEDKAVKASRKAKRSFTTKVNDFLTNQSVKGSVQKPPTKNPRLRK